MIPQLAGQLRAVLIACMIIVPGLPDVRVAHSTELATGSVSGTVKLVWGDRTVPLAVARLELMSISDEGGKYQSPTDVAGKYTIALHPGTYNMRLDWIGGDYADINRTSFRLE